MAAPTTQQREELWRQVTRENPSREEVQRLIKHARLLRVLMGMSYLREVPTKGFRKFLRWTYGPVSTDGFIEESYWLKLKKYGRV